MSNPKRTAKPSPTQAILKPADPSEVIRSAVAYCAMDIEGLCGRLSGVKDCISDFMNNNGPGEEGWQLLVYAEALDRYAADLKKVEDELYAIGYNQTGHTIGRSRSGSRTGCSNRHGDTGGDTKN